ncbi:alpha-1,2-mannosyltransferase ALG9 [Anoplophora glabripennis]|uniref:alpha-1,2-mannosyltransferase ALG9 n=1 Tax=Anoplophora glabripennis TaxID=217634 RepID=UPI000875233E|nr:alpha-1,2-mannosyltransferase ALG9 [Anoplophora glabripennis]
MTKSQLSFRLRQNAPQPMRKDSRKETHRKPAKTQISKIETNNTALLFPAGETAFKILLSARFCAAIWSHISDCDETFNYWEPMHYLVFGKGLQTWEYSPEFGLRSYFYIMVHAAPAWIYHKLLQPNPLLMFYFVRCLLGLICAFAEVYFYKAICKEFGVHIGRICLAFQLFSAGMFVASTAFLPSSFAMYTCAAACAAWWQQKFALAIFFTALGSLLGWPFAALLGIPIAFDMLFRKQLYIDFAAWSGISALVILVPMIIIDSLIYGRFIIAPFNIVKYNVLGGAGPNLYGTEPLSYYFVNGFLNFNFIWILALLSPLAVILNYFFVPSKNKSTLYLPFWLSLSPLFLWLTVFMLQEHKEERFLFPIYPIICLSGAITVDILQKLCFRIWTVFKKMPIGTHYLDKTIFIMIAVMVITSLLGVSRIFALYRNYHAPLDLMMELNRYPLEAKISDRAQVNVCIGKDWHRYPSSFFLPNTNWNIRFIKSEFNGMLPAPYAEGENATTIVHSYFNDKNQEDISLYFDLNKCHFLLDLDLGKETDLEPIYAKRRDKWKIVKSYRFLNAEKSNKYFRAFFVPFLSDRYVVYGTFSLLQSSKLKIK